MKIAFVCPFYKPVFGGVGQVVEELALRYLKEGNDVHVFCSDWDEKKRITVKKEIINGVNLHRCVYWFILSKYASFWPSVFWKLMKGNFDVIHSHASGHPHQFFAALAAKLKGIPHIHTTHAPWIEGSYRSLKSRILTWISYRTFTNLAYKMTNKIVAITPWELNYIYRHGGRKYKTVVIENGMSEIFLKRISKNNFRKENKIKNKLVLFFGRIGHIKGPDKFVLAAKEILSERNDIDFVLVGPDGDMAKTIQYMIKGFRGIKWLGPLYDKKKIAEMYQAADVYVLPSYREGLPLTLFEAMASGLPIVATPTNGVPYILKENVNGLFAEYGDIKAIKNGILRIIDNPESAKKMAINNRNAAKKYTWNERAMRYMEVYREFINSK